MYSSPSIAKRYAYWTEIGRQYSMFPQERNHPVRYSPISAHKLWRKGPSKNRLLVMVKAWQTTMAPLHSSAQLEGGVAAQTPRVQRSEQSIALRVICGHPLPWLQCRAVARPLQPICDQHAKSPRTLNQQCHARHDDKEEVRCSHRNISRFVTERAYAANLLAELIHRLANDPVWVAAQDLA